ncbi:MAG: hypothetical protein A3G41_06115 [Elusimicrobia bacterium RIFCSPLOWO2_12_FULL_59_9]|nr:MAG: hypothetical protein A3G41_06115 [Elusimicrobia bacterium RIFCSPLOWO2_12_FULL_59_9]
MQAISLLADVGDETDILEIKESLLQQRLALLRKSNLWTALSDETLRNVASAMRPMRHKSGQLLIRQGDLGTRLHILASGQMEVRVRTEAGTIVTVAMLKEGDCVCEMSLLTGDTASADVVAAVDSQTLVLERPAFEALLGRNPQLLRELVRIISRRLQATDISVGAAREKEKNLTQFLQQSRSETQAELLGKHATIKAVQQKIDALVKTDDPVLIQGERGTGKETIASLLHFRGPRKGGPLIKTDCAQISDTPFGDKLFGAHGAVDPSIGNAQTISYFQLAAGGTILLKNVDALPWAVQERLARFMDGEFPKTQWSRQQVRIIATSSNSLLAKAKARQVSPELARVFYRQIIEVPPLREHKRDIPEIARYFLKKESQRINKPTMDLTEQALIKLVSYDYRFANVAELKEAVERAANLSDESAANAEEIFLGPPPKPRPFVFNWLSLPDCLVKRILWFFPRGPQIAAAAVFTYIFHQCFFGPTLATGNLSTLLVWSLWWPALALSFFLFGRAWCAICPMAQVGEAAQKVMNLKWRLPSWLKDYDTALVAAGFFAIVYVEEVSGMRHSPLATGILLLSIMGGALATSILFPRRSWCRHLCPLGGFAGLCASSSIVELRPSLDICTAKCAGHACYKGSETIAGCPMFGHVMFQDSNQHCVLCLKCVRTCPNGSPQLNLRAPGQELWSRREARPQFGRFVLMLLGLVASLLIAQRWELHPNGLFADLLAAHRIPMLSALLAAGAAAPLAAAWLAFRKLAPEKDWDPAAPRWHAIIAWAPLALFGFIAYQIAYVPGLDRLFALLVIKPATGGGVTLSVLSLFRVFLVSAGFMVTLGVLWNRLNSKDGPSGRIGARVFAFSSAAAGAYWALLLVLMLAP